MMFRTALADALHQSGELTEAQKFFREAEAMQQQSQPKYPYLYSVQGFQFCDLLLSQGQHQEVQKRAHQTLEWAIQNNSSLLTRALVKLSLGRAFLLEASDRSLAATDQYFTQARDYMQQAVAGLRESGNQDELPRGLLARAAFYRTQNDFALAWADLEEAREIAERGEMKLHLADYHLEPCRLCLAQHAANTPGVETSRRDVSTLAISTSVDSTPDYLSNARQHLATAEEMITEMGYGRRKPDVEELRRALNAL